MPVACSFDERGRSGVSPARGSSLPAGRRNASTGGPALLLIEPIKAGMIAPMIHPVLSSRPGRIRLVSLILATLSVAASAAKTDVIVLANGNSITGEIRSLSRGKLEYSTDDMGTLSVEWDKVTSIRSTTRFQVQTAVGLWFAGTFPPSDRPGWMVVAGTDDVVTLEMASVVQIDRFEKVFWQRLKGNIDFGFNLAKANESTQYNFDFGLKYRGQKGFSQFSFSSYLNKQEGSDHSTRNYLENKTGYYFHPAWTAFGIAQFQQNEELDLAIRSLFGGGAGRRLIASNRMKWIAGAGLSAGSEKYYGDDEPTTFNSEILLLTEWEAFRYDRPKLDFTVGMTVYLSVSEWGRVRTDFSSKLRFELLKDFFLVFGVYDYYDNQPSEKATSNHDYGVNISFSWTFG